jgi:uncharacterized protein
MGFAGSLHCVGMCGGISIALNQSTTFNNKSLTLTYHTFRVISYSILGALMAGIGFQLNQWTDFPLLLVISGAFMILLGVYFLGWGKVLNKIEAYGYILWKKIQPLQARFIPIKHYYQAAAIGLLWGFLPCGLIYSALVMAATTGSWINGGLAMLAFGFGTLPALLGFTFMGHGVMHYRSSRALKFIIAAVFIAWGSFNLYSAWPRADTAHHMHH